jgi:DNA-binding response OmpR family regulator
MAKFLFVEDDPRIARFVERGLAAEGHVVDVVGTGEEALALARVNSYPLMILDRMLPDMDGLDVCRQLRQERVDCRILMLTALDGLSDKLGGLRAGADDYLTKPFSFDELVARVEALLRRSDLVRHQPELRVADLVLDPGTHKVIRGARAIELTPKEYTLLRYLMENAGTVISREQILSNNWGYSFDPETKVVEVYIRYLRKKVDEGEAVQLIQTIRGAGYRIGEPFSQ